MTKDAYAKRIDRAVRCGLMVPGQYWAGLIAHPGYLVGAHGEVISLLHEEPKILKPIRIGEYDGYQLRQEDGRFVKRYRHRLVAEIIYGPAKKGHHCRHLDGDKTNCDFSNLQWGTPSENARDKMRHGTHIYGERQHNSKLTDNDVRNMRADRAAGASFKEIAQKYGVATMSAHRAVTGTTWKSVQ